MEGSGGGIDVALRSKKRAGVNKRTAHWLMATAELSFDKPIGLLIGQLRLGIHEYCRLMLTLLFTNNVQIEASTSEQTSSP